ncbi:MAG: phosphatidate cytidylyltransferase [Eubacteriales bacterium]|nr:phosphatidate cytidylyltransferase [Eubacteriales bacterium]
MSGNPLSSSARHSMGVRTITGVVLVAILVPVILFGNWAYFVAVFLLALVAIHEILAVPGPGHYNWFVKGVVYVFVLSFIYWTFIKNWVRYPELSPLQMNNRFVMSDIFISITGIVLYLLILFLVAINNPKMQLQDVTYLFTMGLLLAFGFMSFYFIRYFPNSSGIDQNPSIANLTFVPDWSSEAIPLQDYFEKYYESYYLKQDLASSLLAFYILIGTWLSDVGAYLFGTFFGKHRMNPRISPHKTWEGYFGGVLLSGAVCFAFSTIMEYCFNIPLVPGILQYRYSAALDELGVFHGYGWFFPVLVTLLFPFVGNVGGFLFSLVKRQYGIKDFGRIFPGHGGVIDRFDSVFTNSIITMIIVWITTYGWNLTI